MSSFKRLALAVTALALAMGGVWAQGISNSSVLAKEKTMVELKVGDVAPVFESIDDQGKPWKSSDHFGKKIVVIYFYPADMTGGCTKQACSFRDDMKQIEAKNVEVIGISGDSVKNHQVFKAVHKLPFTLLADEKGTVAKKFGVPVTEGEKKFETKDENGNAITLTRGCTIQRWTFVIGMDGKILMKNTKVNAAEDSKKILEVIPNASAK